ncbi:MAG: YggS family pyridoxal phosphate-dependent enzyme [Lentisphaerae bacterium]|nr:YggS family pyridoxal phosphate-dependent enzyme [Lentisphaerota bacterium]
MSIMQERVEQVQAGIAAACARAGRAVDEVGLVAVSKMRSPDDVAAAAAAGLRVFGESRVQEAAQKIPLCPGRLTWHFIGHLQTNKVRPAVGLFSMIHAVDSWKLLDTLDRVCGEEGGRLPVCLEVNVSGERSKFGMAPDDVPRVLVQSAALSRVSVVGLMTVPPFDPDPEKARPFFARLRGLRDRWRRETGVALEHLSMGMSLDYGVAIEEGATWIRVGTTLFGERAKA